MIGKETVFVILENKFANSLYKNIPCFLEGVLLGGKTLFFFVKTDNVNKVLFILFKHYNYLFLTDILVVDMLVSSSRFHLDYKVLHNFFSNLFIDVHAYRSGIIIRTVISFMATLHSSSNIFSSANSLEREIWDMFGIFFTKHPNLRRILTDYGFQGHPFKKDFPLTGYVETRYDTSLQRIVLEPVELMQEFRNFDFLSPWINQH